MTLSLDDVRNKRFRMARKSGYEVLEVDEFVDEVEETFAQLVEENTSLKKQLDAVRSDSSAGDEAPTTASTPAPAAPAKAGPERDGRPAERIVVTASKEASSAVVRLVEMSTEQSERLVAEADAEAGRIRAEASRNAEQVTTDARTRAERAESEARTNAERLQADAVGRAERLDRELETRRADMFGHLEKQRESLIQTVTSLREFEADYRSSLVEHLHSQLDSLGRLSLEPAGGPDRQPQHEQSRDGSGQDSKPSDADPGTAAEDSPTLGGGSSRSDTPRLDALLGDQG